MALNYPGGFNVIAWPFWWEEEWQESDGCGRTGRRDEAEGCSEGFDTWKGLNPRMEFSGSWARQHERTLGSDNSSQFIASKDTRNSVLPMQGIEFCQQSGRARNSSPNLPDMSTYLLTPYFWSFEILTRGTSQVMLYLTIWHIELWSNRFVLF